MQMDSIRAQYWPGQRGGRGEQCHHTLNNYILFKFIVPASTWVKEKKIFFRDSLSSCWTCVPLSLTRPLSQPVPYALHCPLEEDADSISLARSISKDSLASNIMSITPKHLLRSGPQLPQHRLSGQSLLSHMHIEDEEEEIEEEELVAVIHPSAFSRRRLGSDMEQDELEIQSATTPSKVPNTRCSPRHDMGSFALEHQADSYYLEP